jgi:hypothetical protein
MSAAVKKRKAAKVITALGGTTVLAGWALWLHDMGAYGGLQLARIALRDRHHHRRRVGDVLGVRRRDQRRPECGAPGRPR